MLESFQRKKGIINASHKLLKSALSEKFTISVEPIKSFFFTILLLHFPSSETTSFKCMCDFQPTADFNKKFNKKKSGKFFFVVGFGFGRSTFTHPPIYCRRNISILIQCVAGRQLVTYLINKFCVNVARATRHRNTSPPCGTKYCSNTIYRNEV